jgi:hypothetical protein
MSFYTLLHSLLNVLVQIANKMRLQKKKTFKTTGNKVGIAPETSTALAFRLNSRGHSTYWQQDGEPEHSLCLGPLVGKLHTVCGHDSARSCLIYRSRSDIGMPISVFINLATVGYVTFN